MWIQKGYGPNIIENKKKDRIVIGSDYIQKTCGNNTCANLLSYAIWCVKVKVEGVAQQYIGYE